MRDELRAALDAGLSLANDPRNADRPRLGRRVTTTYSPWYTRTCGVCQLKFREGDRVRLCPECDEPYHDDDTHDLHCWQRHFSGGGPCRESGKDRFSEREIPPCTFVWDGRFPDDAGAPEDEARQDAPVRHGPSAALVESFVDGLERYWRPFGELKAAKVEPGSDLVGRSCPWCRFRVRAGDWVVACPCKCDCGTYFHQDVFRHMTCWNEWNGVEGNAYCPTTGCSFPGGDDDGDE